MTILVAEDYPAIRRILTDEIAKIAPEAELLSAFDGETALRLAEGKRVDLLVTDYGMNPGNGVFLSHELRKQNPGVTIFMLSSNIDLDKYVTEAGANRGFHKYQLEDLFAEVKRFVGCE